MIHRSEILFYFYFRKINSTVEDCALELMRHIEEQTSEGQQIDMLTFYQEFTLDVIGRIAMGQTDSQMFKNPMFPIIKKVSSSLSSTQPILFSSSSKEATVDSFSSAESFLHF